MDKDPGWEMDTQLQRTKDRPPPRSLAPFSQGPGMLAWLSSEERPDGSSDAPAQTPSRLLGYMVAWGPQRVSWQWVVCRGPWRVGGSQVVLIRIGVHRAPALTPKASWGKARVLGIP